MPVLIVEDDPGVIKFLNQALSEAGYETETAETGPAGLNMALKGEYALILLDVMLPELDGFSVCRRLRAQGVGTPILIITARDAVEDKIEGLDSGADDYIVKPFQLGELLARCRALGRRHAKTSSTVLRVADLTLDPVSRKAFRAGKPILLSSTEYSLLEYLMRHTGQVLTRGMILDHVWQYDFDGHDNVLDVYISYLRAKIDRGSASPLIHTVRGKGFVFENRPHAR
jgi:DNA-binding response OmpR family regulator